MRPVETTSAGNTINIPDGMVHQWIGLAFIRGRSLALAESLLLDYNNYAAICAPEVRRSNILAHSDDTYKILVQFFSKSPRMSFDVYSVVRYFEDDPQHTRIRVISTQVRQLRNPGDPNGVLLAAGRGSGYLWRLNDYWRIGQKDGGVYVQVESIELSRGVPFCLSWVIDPIVEGKSRRAVSALLSAARRALYRNSAAQQRVALHPHHFSARVFVLGS